MMIIVRRILLLINSNDDNININNDNNDNKLCRTSTRPWSIESGPFPIMKNRLPERGILGTYRFSRNVPRGQFPFVLLCLPLLSLELPLYSHWYHHHEFSYSWFCCYAYGDHARLAMGRGKWLEYVLMVMPMVMFTQTKHWQALVLVRGSGSVGEA